MYGETHRPYSRLCRARNTNSILATRNWVERHWVYSGHYPRIFVGPNNARNTETKRRLGAVPILLLVMWVTFHMVWSPNLGYLKHWSTTQPHQLGSYRWLWSFQEWIRQKWSVSWEFWYGCKWSIQTRARTRDWYRKPNWTRIRGYRW